jgi:hypothetical protein
MTSVPPQTKPRQLHFPEHHDAILTDILQTAHAYLGYKTSDVKDHIETLLLT